MHQMLFRIMLHRTLTQQRDKKTKSDNSLQSCSTLLTCDSGHESFVTREELSEARGSSNVSQGTKKSKLCAIL